MCLIVFGYKAHSTYDLIFAANRDELHKRPAEGARFWNDYPDILAGKDVKAGGTWMGINKSGQFSAITNYRDPSSQKADAPSRGHLVLDYLKTKKSPGVFLDEVDHRAEEYNGFSMLAGNLQELIFYSNRQREKITVEPGIHGLSNHLLNTPWPKVERARRLLGDIMDAPEVSEDAIFSLLGDEERPSAEELPDTGLSRELEEKVSPVFIRDHEYGTRSSTVLLIDRNKEAVFTEKRYRAGTKQVEEVNRYQFTIR